MSTNTSLAYFGLSCTALRKRNKIPFDLDKLLTKQDGTDSEGQPKLVSQPFNLGELFGKYNDSGSVYHELLPWLCVHFLDNCMGAKDYSAMIKCKYNLWEKMTKSDMAFVVLVFEAHYLGWKRREELKAEGKKVVKNKNGVHAIALTDEHHQKRHKSIFREIRVVLEEPEGAKALFESTFWKIYKDEEKGRATKDGKKGENTKDDDDDSEEEEETMNFDHLIKQRTSV